MKRPPNKNEKLYIGIVVAMGCIVCRNEGLGKTPCEYHHTLFNEGKSQRAGHYSGLGLCPTHHRNGKKIGQAIHHGRMSWETLHGTEKDLLDQTIGEVFIIMAQRRADKQGRKRC